MNNVLFSIIIPVYNTEKHLENCINSVLNQTYDNFEICIIDDGSTDKSGSICDCFSEKDKRIKVTHISNKGVSNARNLGIQNASGDYIIFLDSDDWIENNALEVYYNLICDYNAEMIVSKSYYRDENNVMQNDFKGATVIPKESALKKLVDLNFATSLCMCAYRRDIIKDKKLNTKVHFWEDLEFQFRVISSVDNTVVNAVPIYHYRSGSDTHGKLTERKLSCFSVPKLIKEADSDSGIIEDSAFEVMTIKFIFDMATLGGFDRGNHKQCDKIIRDYALEFKNICICRKDFSINQKINILLLAINPEIYYFLFRIKHKR